MTTPRLHLASSSPRRKAILEALGLTFTAAGVDLDEARLDGESPDRMVLRLAREKSEAAADAAGSVVIGADTAVILGGTLFGKPVDEADALDMLGALSGQTHQVLTGVAVRSPAGVETVLSSTDVRFREIGRDEARAYWQSGEPADKAGAYAIQGRAGVFVEAIEGSYSGVVGLPVFETARLLERAGIAVLTKGWQ